MKALILAILMTAPAMSSASEASEACIQDIIDNSILEVYNNQCDCGEKATLDQVTEKFKDVFNNKCYSTLNLKEIESLNNDKAYYVETCHEIVNDTCPE